MYKVSDATMKNINDMCLEKYNMTYEEYESLDFDEQQKLIKKCKKVKNRGNSKTTTVMIGSGEHATFVSVKKGERIMLEDGIFVEGGVSLEEQQNRVDNALNSGVKVNVKKKILQIFKR